MLKPFFRAGWILAGIFALTGCAMSQGMSNSEIRGEIEAANKNFAQTLSRGDGAGLASLYSAEAYVLPSGSEPITGREAIASYWQGAIDSGIRGATLETLDVEAFGDTANERGEYELFDADGKLLDRGKYVVIWKHRDGAWKLQWDMFSTDGAAK